MGTVCADDPFHLPQLIGPMKHYLHILRVTHGGADLDSALEYAQGYMDGDLQCAPSLIQTNGIRRRSSYELGRLGRPGVGPGLDRRRPAVRPLAIPISHPNPVPFDQFDGTEVRLGAGTAFSEAAQSLGEEWWWQDCRW